MLQTVRVWIDVPERMGFTTPTHSTFSELADWCYIYVTVIQSGAVATWTI